MFLNWLSFFALGITAYIGISLFAQMTASGTASFLQAAINSLKPVPILILVVANVFFALAVYMGFKTTSFAIPATISVGIITSYFYSVAVLGGVVSTGNLVGVALVLAGIFLLR